MIQRHIQVTRPVTTAHLAQTMTLLTLTSEELKQQIDAELSSNPALELTEERHCPICQRPLPPRGNCPVCSKPKDDKPDEAIIFVSPREDFFTRKGDMGDEVPEDIYGSQAEDLPTYVLRQIGPELNKTERHIAAFLLTHLDEDGLLTTTLAEVARYFHVSVTVIEKIQGIIQRADPIGVGSCNPREAILVQISVLAETASVPTLARRIVEEGIDGLMHRQYPELARKFHVSVRQIRQAVEFISNNLNPFPARSFWGETQTPEISARVYRQPDIIISLMNDDPKNPLVVEIIFPISGTLRVNPLFKQVVKQTDDERRGEWRSDLDRASLFVKCLQQRNHTMIRLMQKVVSLQRGYILKGESYLISVTRSSLAKELEVHESTISRAVSNKTIQLPNKRIVPLSSFFDRNLNIRTILKGIILTERKPLSDNELVSALKNQGYQVARRTVAKYRAMEGILPAHLRASVQAK
jgi:RNA polymerase sigma-54 factor